MFVNVLRSVSASREPPRLPPNSIDLVWTEGIRLIAAQLAAADALDRKTSPLVALISAAFALAFGQRDHFPDLIDLLLVELTVVFVFLLLAFRLRRFSSVPALPVFMKWANSPPEDVKTQFMGNLLQAYERNQKSLASKELFLAAAIYAMLFVIVTSLAVVVGGTGGMRSGGPPDTRITP